MATKDEASGARCTVYVRNLEERVKLDDMREALESLFSTYGNVIDIVAKKNLKAKGQAFIVFDDPSAAEQAIQEIQGFELFEKPMQLDFAKTRSDATVKRVGGDEDFELHKRRRLAEKERKQAQEALENQKMLKRTAANGLPDALPSRPSKAPRGPGLKSTNPGGGQIPDEYLPPNKILFVRNLSDEYDVEGLTTLFARFEGFMEVRMVPGRKGMAFVEYETETGAISAKENIAGMELGAEQKPVQITYQRK